MGDISRHRDIYLNTRAVTPTALLGKCNLTVNDLTYLELGNYLTDVAQFRDPVTYIFSKQRIWREFILKQVGEKTETPKALAALAGSAALLAGELIKERTSGVTSDIAKYGGRSLAGIGGVLAALPNDLIAGIMGADDWIDKMFGTPIERVPGDLQKREQKHYGYIGQFFKHFIEGITQLLFADNITNKVKGPWGQLDRIPVQSVAAVFNEFFTQYYPHEHTDQPPYIWDASKRPASRMYQPGNRQATITEPNIGVMRAVDDHYVQYLAEGLSDLEHDWRQLKPNDSEGRHKMLVRMGKLLHGIEDWFFHSNVVEIFRLRSYRPKNAGETDEEYLMNFVNDIASKDPEFVNATPAERLRLQRKLYRRLRFPEYERGTKTQSAGIISKTKPSTVAIHHAYPAFPSQQDTAHTLMHALENLERKVTHPTNTGPTNEIPPWAPCVVSKFVTAKGGDGEKLLKEKAEARKVNKLTLLADLASPGGPKKENVIAVVLDVLREWVPLALTLLNESERQRLVANVDPLQWPVGGSTTIKAEKGKQEGQEADLQLKRHKEALQQKAHHDGVIENNYERLLRLLVDCGFLNTAGHDALVKAFEVDHTSQQLLDGAPGAGGFLIKFSLELQASLDAGDSAVEALNKNKNAVFDQASDNGAFNEIVGSHSLMSKDTLQSPPFFDEARVFASLASSSVFHIMLQQISGPAKAGTFPWEAVLHHFIRYPVANGGWERRAMAFFRDPKNKGQLPRFTDLPELANLVASALQSRQAQQPWKKGTKDNDLKERYIRLEAELSKYRYP